MKPRVFIGSSGDTEAVAQAIHANLSEGECTTWTTGVFQISKNTLENLYKLVRTSDFGVFVFSTIDVAKIKKTNYSIVRDNVVFELGLFVGRLGPDRCYFAIPDNTSADLHLPSDLAGVTWGKYEGSRSDNSWRNATLPFCNEINENIRRLGFAHNERQERLYEFAVRLECCDLIPDNADPPRWRYKPNYISDMRQFCTRHPVNKALLVQHHSQGFYVAAAIAIIENTKREDMEVLRNIDFTKIQPRPAQDIMVEAANSLFNKFSLQRNEKNFIFDQLRRMPNRVKETEANIDDLQKKMRVLA